MSDYEDEEKRELAEKKKQLRRLRAQISLKEDQLYKVIEDKFMAGLDQAVNDGMGKVTPEKWLAGVTALIVRWEIRKRQFDRMQDGLDDESTD